METGDQLDRWHMSTLNGKQTRWRQLKRRRDWPPETEQVLVTIQDGGKRMPWRVTGLMSWITGRFSSIG